MQKLYKLVLVHFSSTENEVLQLIKIHPYSFLLLLLRPINCKIYCPEKSWFYLNHPEPGGGSPLLDDLPLLLRVSQRNRDHRVAVIDVGAVRRGNVVHIGVDVLQHVLGRDKVVLLLEVNLQVYYMNNEYDAWHLQFRFITNSLIYICKYM